MVWGILGTTATNGSLGNLLDDGVRTYDYDYANRLIAVVSGTLTTTYIYNGDGHRLAKAVNGQTTTYTVAVLGLSQVLVETTGGDSIVYLYGHDLLAEEDDAWNWHLGDGLGSVRQLAESGGGISLAQGYTPFGVPLWSEGTGATGYGFTGERWEAYTELLFLRARYYDPAAGRFLTLDPSAGDCLRPQSLFPSYQYAGGNPISFVDPAGLKEWRRSSSWVERIIGRVYEQGRREIHLEYSMPLGGWRPDILNSYTGDVFEIKPLGSGHGAVLAWGEAEIYALGLNSFKSDTLLGGPVGLLPHNDPNNWNSIDWHPGSPVSFPPLVIPGLTPIPTAHGTEYINAPFDLVTFCVLPGSVTWHFVPKPEVAAAVTACYLAKEFWSKHVLGAQILKDATGPCTTCPSPSLLIVPEILLDPTNPWNPMNPLNCWDHPEYCEDGGPKS